MNERLLPIPDGYDSQTQRIVGGFAWQLDDQLSRLKESVAGMTTESLQWQLRPGMNTVGMLLAHLAVVEIFWLLVVPRGLPFENSDEVIKPIIGISGYDDGLPLKEDGLHPQALAGKTLDDYLRMLEDTRAATHAELQRWTDDELDHTHAMQEHTFSRGWILYHVLEHLCAHYGQILLLNHMMRDKGILDS
jgi:hypothetical protein